MQIELTISNMPDSSETLAGFTYFWLKYVKGFDPNMHCQDSLKGTIDKKFQNEMKIGRTILLKDSEEYKHIYLCGEPFKESAKQHLSALRNWERAKYPYPGLHLALLPEEGSNASIETYNGVHITCTNVRQLEIPYLPDFFAGMEHAYTSCCNWQFGAAYYGLENLHNQGS
jgi:hypothetical protein